MSGTSSKAPALGGVGGLIDELAGHESSAPQVRADDELDPGGARHGIERHPEADVGGAIDAVVGLVVVPRRDLVGVGLLHQCVFVEEAGCLAEKAPRQLRKWSVERGLPVPVDPLPVDVVAEEAAGATLWRVVVGPWAGSGEVLVDGDREVVQLGSVEHAPNSDDAVASEGVHLLHRGRA